MIGLHISGILKRRLCTESTEEVSEVDGLFRLFKDGGGGVLGFSLLEERALLLVYSG